MIDYPRQSWLPLLLAIKGTVLPRVAIRTLLLAGIALGLTALAQQGIFKVDVPSLAHSLIGVALGLLLVFRTNASYDRYWEGRKQWGAIVNTCRNLVRAAASYTRNPAPVAELVTAYALALKQHLRGEKSLDELRSVLPGRGSLVDDLTTRGNPPVYLALHVSRWIDTQVRAGATSEGGLAPEFARTLEGYVAALLDAQGACERILRTPMPFAYVVHIRQLLILYLVSLPFVLVGPLGWSAPVAVAFIAFGLLGIEEIGVEIEDPFGTDPNDLPVDAMCATIARDVKMLSVG